MTNMIFSYCCILFGWPYVHCLTEKKKIVSIIKPFLNIVSDTNKLNMIMKKEWMKMACYDKEEDESTSSMPKGTISQRYISSIWRLCYISLEDKQT